MYCEFSLHRVDFIKLSIDTSNHMAQVLFLSREFKFEGYSIMTIVAALYGENLS